MSKVELSAKLCDSDPQDNTIWGLQPVDVRA